MKWCRNGTRRSCSTCGCCSTFQSASLAMKLDEGLLHRFCQILSKAVKWFCLLVSNDWHKPQREREHKKRKCRTWKLCVLVPCRCIFLGLAGMCRKAFWLGAPWQNSATGIKKCFRLAVILQSSWGKRSIGGGGEYLERICLWTGGASRKSRCTEDKVWTHVPQSSGDSLFVFGFFPLGFHRLSMPEIH